MWLFIGLYGGMAVFLVGWWNGLRNPHYGFFAMRGRTCRELWHYAVRDPWYYVIWGGGFTMLGSIIALGVMG